MKGKGEYQIYVCDVTGDNIDLESHLTSILDKEIVLGLEESEKVRSYEIKSHDLSTIEGELKLSLLVEVH